VLAAPRKSKRQLTTDSAECGGKDLQKRKVLSLERKSEEVMDDESGESMERIEATTGPLLR